MTELLYGPIEQWPGRLLDDDDRLPAPFSAGWWKTEDLLDREAHMLDAITCTIRLALDRRYFYKGGNGLTANAPLPRHPGVVVVIDSAEHGVLTWSCDRYRRRGYSNEAQSWQHNVRAVALGLEALRQVERYGIAERGEQYAGFTAIGTGMAMGAKRAPMTLDEATRLLAGAVRGTQAGSILSNPQLARSCYRAAWRLIHPDHGGDGDTEKGAQLQEAWRLIDEHHRGAA